MMETEIITDIKDALKQFGEYSYYDKGASDVMFMGPWQKKLNDLPIPERVRVLEAVLDYEHGRPFVEHVVVDSDMRDDFDELLDASPRLAEFY